MADAKTSLPPSLPPTKDDLRLAIGEPYEDAWVEGNHPTDNPDGVTNSNVDYYPKTQEEKAARIGVEMVTVIDVPEGAPYPEGDPPDEEDREAMLERLHTPQELTSAEDWTKQSEANLKAGGATETETEGDEPDDGVRVAKRKTGRKTKR